MTQTITTLGEIGTVGAILTPLDLPLQRDGALWDLTGYASPTIEVWDLRTRTLIASPGPVNIEGAPTLGTIRWVPDSTNFESGVYEARIEVSFGGVPEPAGLFRFSIAAGANP